MNVIIKSGNRSLVSQIESGKNDISTCQYILLTGVTLLGFGIAIIAHLFVPQVAEIQIRSYAYGALIIDMNGAYQIVLSLVMLIYLLMAVFLFRRNNWRQEYVSRAPLRLTIGIILACWDILGTKLRVLPQPFFPGPADIMEAFLLEGDYIWQNTMYSLRLFTTGFTLGVFLGVGTGILIGWFPKIHYWVYPFLKITGVIPAVAWMPFALTIFPTPFAAAAFLIVICSWFSIASLTAQGICSTPKAQFEIARTLGATSPFLIFHVAVPHALPQIFTGISNANGFAFTTLVMAEMMGQPGGLGYYINVSKVWSAYHKVFAAIGVMAVLFSLIMNGLGIVKNRVLRWQKGLVKSSEQ